MKRNEVLELSFEFSLKIIQYCEILEEKRKYVIARQLLKAGTSVGANLREAQSPHSRSDFISKLVIAAKEANETEYWLLLCKKSGNYPDPEILESKIGSIKKLLSKIIGSAKRA